LHAQFFITTQNTGVNTLRLTDHFNAWLGPELEGFFPQYPYLHFSQAVVKAVMNAKTKGQNTA